MGADDLFFHFKACALQAVGEGHVAGDRPDGKDAAGLEGIAGVKQAAALVERVVGFLHEAFGAIVHVQKNGVIGRAGEDELGDVGDGKAEAAVFQAIPEDVRHVGFGPRQDVGHQFGDGDLGVRPQRAQRGAQGEAHAQAADEQLCSGLVLQAFAHQRCQCFFRLAETAVHQLDVAEHDGIFGIALEQLKLAAIGQGCGIELDAGLHELSPVTRSGDVYPL